MCAFVLIVLFSLFIENHISPWTNSSDAGGRVVSTESLQGQVYYNVLWSISVVTFVLFFPKFDLHGAGCLLLVPSEMVMKLFLYFHT